ncbi:Mlf family protein [Megaselia abdita]
MSMFGGFMGDFDDEDVFGNHMRSMNQHMNQMNRLMGSMMGGFGGMGGMGVMGGMGGMDPFNMLMPSPFDPQGASNALMRRNRAPGPMMGFPGMDMISMGGDGGASFCQTSITTMRTGPDGRPQVYQETSSVKGGPGGVKETRKTVQDSHRGIKKMAIGHHIGERAHIIEKEQDTRSGQMEERQDFINLDEDEAEDFDKEFQTKVRSTGRYNDGHQMASITEVGEDYPSGQPLRALPAPPSTSTSSQVAATSVHPHPYNNSAARKNHRSKHSKNRNHDVQIVELPNDD